MGPNEKRNDESSPNSKNFFSELLSARLSVTMETPYFSLEEAKVTRESMLCPGRAFGRNIIKYILEDGQTF